MLIEKKQLLKINSKAEEKATKELLYSLGLSVV